MILFSVLSFLLLMAVAYPIARPFLVGEGADDGVTDLRDERDRLAGSLVDLDMEFSTGKLAVEDYRGRRERRKAELDEVERGLVAIAKPALSADDEVDELERLIAERRVALSLPRCPTCGAGHDPHDRFCRGCGTDLSEVTPT
jgi:hypothetical protein